MREKCARVLAAALMTGAIGFALAMPAFFGTPNDVTRLLTAPPSSLQGSVRAVALHATSGSTPEQGRLAGRTSVTTAARLAALRFNLGAGAAGRPGSLSPSSIGRAPKPKPKPKPAPSPSPGPTPAPAPAPAPGPDTRQLAAAPPPAPATAPTPAVDPGKTRGRGKGKGKGHTNHGKGHDQVPPGQQPAPAAPPAAPPVTPPTPAGVAEDQQSASDKSKGHDKDNDHGDDKGRGH
jgi:hypothetical protein